MFSVIFDMDGTLLDTQSIYIDAWEYAGSLQGFSEIGKHAICCCGMNDRGSNKYLEAHFKDLDVTAFKEEVRNFFLERATIRLKDGAKELLDFLKKNNIKIALASGTSRNSIDHHLKAVNITEYFDAIVGGGDVKNGKPAPDVFLRAAELIGAAPKNCFVFEDATNGIKAGYAAGMKCIGIPDVTPFDEESREMMFAELPSLRVAIDMLKEYM